MEISFGDNVSVVSTEATKKLGLDGKIGSVYGQTTPSASGVESKEIVGALQSDYAINVYFEDVKRDYWFAEDLLKFVDHGEGTTVTIGEHQSIRSKDGTCNKSQVTKKK